MTARVRVRLLATAMAVVGAAGCAGPKPHIDYAGKAVPINVAFGKPVGDKKPPAPGSTLAPAPSGVGVVPLVPGVAVGGAPAVSTTGVPSPSTAAPAVDPCPPQDPLTFPRREATNVVDASVPEGVFPFRVSGTYTVNGKKTSYAETVYQTVKRLDPDAAGRSRFQVSFNSLGSSYTLVYAVQPPLDPAPGEVGLASIQQNSADGKGASFTPVDPLRLLQLRAEKGTSWTEATTDPLSASSATVDGTIVDKGRLNACGRPVEAWKTQVTQRVITPGQDITATRTLYFATGYGGLLVGEQVSYTGTAGSDKVSGASTSTINVDPGAP